MAAIITSLAFDPFKPRDAHDSSDSMDDMDYSASPSVEGSSGSSLASISPKAEPELHTNFDLSYFLSLANNPDMSSSSSESQSQGSRSGSPPSDWHSTAWPDAAQSPSHSWKWAGDSLMSDGVVDPGSLMLGNLGADDIFANPAFDGSNIPHFSGDELSVFNYENGVPAVTPSLYSVPQIAEPPTSTPLLSVTLNPGLDVESIGRRARELAGVQHAIQQTQRTTNYSPYTASAMRGGVPKSTVPFVPPPPGPQVRSEAPSVPSPSTSSSPPVPEAASESGLGASRPKTAHTTIERRYRTNLNARFIALRHAIPALRVLEKTKFPDEKADDKGYVDGVKAARKASKGTVLGKASEYIRVLKRRELHLRRELEGVKALVSGLVGGPELLVQWEREWVERNGSMEQDQVGSDGDSDDEEGSEDEDEKPKKKAKATPAAKKEVAAKPTVPASTAPPASSTPLAPGELKRKRGRPRKVQPSEARAVESTDVAHTNVAHPTYPYPPHEAPVPSHEGGQYLLGIFILFSFLNPFLGTPNTESTSPSLQHSHVGTVLTALNSTILSHSAVQYVAASPSVFGMSWRECVSYVHTGISMALFLSVIVSIFPSIPSFFWRAGPAVSATSSNLVSATASGSRDDLRHALGCDKVDIQSAMSAVLGACWSLLVSIVRKPGAKGTDAGATRQAWVRLAEMELLEEGSMSIMRRVYTSARLVSCLVVSPSPSELATLALICYPIVCLVSARTWSVGQNRNLSKHERILFDRSVEEAVELYRAGVEILSMQDKKDTIDERITPLGLIAAGFVCGQLRNAASELFLQSIPGDSPSADDVAEEDIIVRSCEGEATDAIDKARLSEAVALGRGLTKPVQALTNLWAEVSADVQVAELAVVTADVDGGRKVNLLSDAKSFLDAIALYRHISSPPPSSPVLSENSTSLADASSFESSSPTTSGSSSILDLAGTPNYATFRVGGEVEAAPRLALLRVLASSAFDRSVETDEARDRLVDLLQERCKH